MSEDIIRYDILVQNALRGVIRKALNEVQKTGLPGNHHFFITFMTHAPGVRVSNRIREQYPDQMTIVLQHQYWDLEVTETGFSVGLSFSDVPETLSVPYAAVRGFYDPSVNFELEFDVETGDRITEDDSNVANISSASDAGNSDKADKDKPAALKVADAEDAPAKKPAKKASTKAASKTAAKAKAKAAAENAEAEAAEAKSDETSETEGADVVSLDAFRKKK